MGVGKIRAVAKALIDELGLVGGGGTALTRANLLVDDSAPSNQWGSWGIKDNSAMIASGGGVVYHLDGTSKILPAHSAEPCIAAGSRFLQRSSAAGSQTVGTWYSQQLLSAHIGLKFTHEMDVIPFDDESNPCLANLARFYWGCFNLNTTNLVNHDGTVSDPHASDLHGFGVTFRVATDTNFYFCTDGGSGTLTRVDSGLAPADGTRYIFRAKYNGFVAGAGSVVLEILDGDKAVLATHTFTTGGPGAAWRINPIVAWMSDGTSIVRSLSIISQSWAMGLPD